MIDNCNFTYDEYHALGGCMVFQKVFIEFNESCMFIFDLNITDGLHVRYMFLLEYHEENIY